MARKANRPVNKNDALDAKRDLALIRATLERRDRGEKTYPEFTRFLALHEARVARYVFSRIDNPDIALDVLQQAKYKMFRSGLLADYQKTPFAYYVTIVKHCLFDAFRLRDKQPKVSIDGDSTKGANRLQPQYQADESWQPDVRIPLANRQSALPRVIEEAIKRVTVKSPKKIQAMTAVQMRFFQKKAVQDIARELGIGRPNTVTKMLQRGLADLKRALASMRREGFPGVEYVYEAL